MINKFIFLCIICSITTLSLFAQPRIYIDGFVKDAANNEPLPYSNIHFKKNKTGTITYSDGRFSINTNTVPDTMIISAIGYTTKFIPINKFKNQHYDILLQSKEFELNEIVIHPGENPAVIIMNKVLDEKKRNDPMNAITIACNTYTKILVNALNEDSQFNIKKGLPIFFSEKISQNIIQKNPYFERGEILTERQEGLGFLKEMSIIGYSNNMSIGFNFYNNVIELFDKPFISPLNNRAFLFYKFYLKDSTITDLGKEYLLEFKPKNDRDLAFTGYLKVIEESWALSEISLTIPQNANLNYVNKWDIYQTFRPVNDSLMFFHINEATAELKITKDKSLFDIDFSALVHKKSVYDSVLLNFPAIEPGNENDIWELINPELSNTKKALDIIDFRPEDLSHTEVKAIATIDSLNNDWKIKSADALSKMFVTGYVPGELFDLGPYLELVKNNRIEGFRYTFAGRTSTNITKNLMIFGHIGYGTRDEEWKYGTGVKYKYGKNNRRLLTAEYRNDLSKIGDNRSIFLIKENQMLTGEDNVIASIFTNKPLDKLSREIRYRFEYEHELKDGISSFISFNNRSIYSGEFLPFMQNGNPIEKFTTNEIMLGLRFSWHERFTDNYCRRFYMGTSYPIVNFRLTGGQYQLKNFNDKYLNARLVVNHDFFIGLTKFDYVLESGFTLGTVPFPLLDINRTNQSLGYALYSFNMMDEMEFVSDRFASIMAQYHLNGLLFNRIPILKQMGIREVFSAKVLWSHLSDEHNSIIEFPRPLYDAQIPYTELSVGVENFFQYFRVDVVWRLSQLENPGANPLGLRARFDVTF
ncbi:MAG: DUF5686 family protein [Prolixibacteraceae bacterium]|jgi:hypothetical protein|nr:DUF5686 family protein [Prolixibacteraceae bacterium]